MKVGYLPYQAWMLGLPAVRQSS